MPVFSDGAPNHADADRGETGLLARKAELRRQSLAARRSLSAAVLAHNADRVRATAAALVRRMRPTTVAAYAPLRDEPGGSDLPAALAEPLGDGGRVLLPVLLDDLDLDWAVWTPGEALRSAGRGMREPPGPRLGPGAVAAADLVLVPALAVDGRGLRLGRGGGSYDRALARVRPPTVVVALLHDGELVESVPAQPHDRPVDAVIMPSSGLVRLDGGADHAALLALG